MSLLRRHSAPTLPGYAPIVHAPYDVGAARIGPSCVGCCKTTSTRALHELCTDEVIDAAGVVRGAVEVGHRRALATVFGDVTVERLAYRRRGHANLHPADAALNLSAAKHSHGLRRLAAIEAARGSFDHAVDAIARITGQQLGKRQVEALSAQAAVDVDALQQPPATDGDSYRQREATTGKG